MKNYFSNGLVRDPISCEPWGAARNAPMKTGDFMTSELLKATLDLLAQTSKESWPALAKEIDCTYTWIVQLEKGTIKEPGINKIERLYIALGGKSISF